MRMIKLIFFLFFANNLLSAQSSQSLKVSVDYSYQFSLAGESLFDGNFQDNTQSLIYGSYGRGNEWSLDFKYSFESGHIVGLRLSKLFGHQYKAHNTLPNGVKVPIVKGESEFWKTSLYYGRDFQLHENFYLGVNFGACVGIDMKRESTFYRSGNDRIVEVFSGNAAYGIYSSLQFNYLLTKIMSLSIFVNHYSMSWAAKQSEVVVYEVNGVNDLTQYNGPLIVTYVNEAPLRSDTELLKRYEHYSSIGIGIGVLLRI